jgi:hypothetical protein
MVREDDDRRPGDGGPGDGGPVDGEPFSLEHLVVPDDARALAADARALQRERRAGARRRLLGRLFLTRRWRQYGVSGPIVVGVLMLVAAFASLMLLFQPRRTTTRPVPLATGVRGVGQEGGLLPELSVRRADGQEVAVRDYRPAVVAVLPAACGCDARLRTFGLAAIRHHLQYLLIGPAPPTTPAELADGAVIRAGEPTGRLAAAYRVRHDPVLLLVRGDGVVNRILAAQPSTAALDAELAVLVATGATDQH